MNISPFHQLRRLHTEPRHQFLRLTDSILGGFTIAEDNFQFEKVSQSFHAVEVDASSADEKRVRCFRTRPIFPYATESTSRSFSGSVVGEAGRKIPSGHIDPCDDRR